MGRIVGLAFGVAVLLPLAAMGQQVGQQFDVQVSDLPAPYATSSARNGPQTVARPAGMTLNLPDGFTATLYAENLSHPRELIELPNGDVLVSEPRAGHISLLRDADGNGQAELIETFVDGMIAPYGMALHDGYLHIADGRGVFRVPYADGDVSASAAPEAITDIGVFGSGRGHWTRSLAFHPTENRFYVGVGSRGNIDVEDEPRATIMEFTLNDGEAADGRIFAGGLRNAVGVAFYPGSTDLFTVVNERDGMGDGLVPDYLTSVQDGGFYGWPYAYLGPNPQPGFADRRPDLVAASIEPDLLFMSHSAPIDVAFYEGRAFPADYHGDAFVSLRGSWNRSDPTGYIVVRVPFENGAPSGGYEVFATGFRLDDGASRAQVWGRPTGLLVTSDGALLIADDTSGTIWRITYEG
ncbi:MAG: PQQ-dependent sugar dehydrogenase [Pseudomonadota bacterium]